MYLKRKLIRTGQEYLHTEPAPVWTSWPKYVPIGRSLIADGRPSVALSPWRTAPAGIWTRQSGSQPQKAEIVGKC